MVTVPPCLGGVVDWVPVPPVVGEPAEGLADVEPPVLPELLLVGFDGPLGSDDFDEQAAKSAPAPLASPARPA